MLLWSDGYNHEFVFCMWLVWMQLLELRLLLEIKTWMINLQPLSRWKRAYKIVSSGSPNRNSCRCRIEINDSVALSNDVINTNATLGLNKGCHLQMSSSHHSALLSQKNFQFGQ